MAFAGAGADAQTFTLRISTENSEAHFQTRIVAAFADALTARSAGRLDVRHSPGGTLFSDRDVIRALQQGQVEMAVPGTWQIDRLVPDVGLFLLPMFYGRDQETIHAVADGPPGREVGARIERQLQLKVVGRWLDLGFTHVFGIGASIRDYDDLVGRRIRVAGGNANLARLEVLGAQGVVIPWPDLPATLALGTVDGVLTSFETVASARLWEKGLTSAFADRQYFAQYVPLLSLSFWERLPDDLRTTVTTVWEESVEPGRRLAETAQRAARDSFVDQGGAVIEPASEDRTRAREALQERQDSLAAALGIDPALVDLTRHFLDR